MFIYRCFQFNRVSVLVVSEAVASVAGASVLSVLVLGVVEQAVEDAVIVSVINRFLYADSPKNRNIFIRRYWYLCTIREIADSYEMSESNVKVLLFRMRSELKKQLEKEGVYL